MARRRVLSLGQPNENNFDFFSRFAVDSGNFVTIENNDLSNKIFIDNIAVSIFKDVKEIAGLIRDDSKFRDYLGETYENIVCVNPIETDDWEVKIIGNKDVGKMNNVCKKTIPLILLCEKSINAFSFEKIKKCANKICESVKQYLTDNQSYNVKIIAYSVSSEIEKYFVNSTITENFEIEGFMLSNTISFSRIYGMLESDLSRSAVLEGIESLGIPVIILIADGSSHYIQCIKMKDDYYSQNRFLRAAKKIVISIDEPSINTKESFEMFAGRDSLIVFNDDTFDGLIDAMCQALFVPCVSSGMRNDYVDVRSIIQDTDDIVKVDPFDEEIEACTDDTDWGSNQDWE